MPIYVMENGVKRELSSDEIAERERYFSSTPATEPTTEERIAALEEELKAAKILLGLEA